MSATAHTTSTSHTTAHDNLLLSELNYIPSYLHDVAIDIIVDSAGPLNTYCSGKEIFTHADNTRAAEKFDSGLPMDGCNLPIASYLFDSI